METEHQSTRLVVGLGNPGKEYENTRHNLGALAVRSFAEAKGACFQKNKYVEGELSCVRLEHRKVYFLLPTTYMNVSGHSVKKCMDYPKISLPNLLIVVDDCAIPFEEVRLRSQGSSGGHNGLKNVAERLGSQEYARLKVGIGDREHGDLSDYVLGKFTQEERKLLPTITEKAALVIQEWLCLEQKL